MFLLVLLLITHQTLLNTESSAETQNDERTSTIYSSSLVPCPSRATLCNLDSKHEKMGGFRQLISHPCTLWTRVYCCCAPHATHEASSTLPIINPSVFTNAWPMLNIDYLQAPEVQRITCASRNKNVNEHHLATPAPVSLSPTKIANGRARKNKQNQ